MHTNTHTHTQRDNYYDQEMKKVKKLHKIKQNRNEIYNNKLSAFMK